MTHLLNANKFFDFYGIDFLKRLHIGLKDGDPYNSNSKASNHTY